VVMPNGIVDQEDADEKNKSISRYAYWLFTPCY
jgi:hypothetical protein